MTVWFTADLHLGHAAVIKYAKRPFEHVQDMDRALVGNWNEAVEPGDLVYVVGDFSFMPPARTVEVLRNLKGQKYLVRGNHDRITPDIEKSFVWVRDLETIKVSDPEAPDGRQSIVLCHYAMRVWNKSHYGAWQLYGHSHGSLPDDPNARAIDVGVDCWDYRPVSYEQVKVRMAAKTFKPVDHHGERD